MNQVVCKSKFILCVTMFTLFLALPALAWQPDHKPPPEQLKKLEKMNDQRRKQKNTTALLFGKVIDFSGEPVAGATVTMRLSAVPRTILHNDQRLVTTKTNADGTFTFENTGFMYYLVDIVCDGYQFRMEYNKSRSLEFRPNIRASGKGYEPDKPMIFKVRKKAPPAFVLTGGWRFFLEEGEQKLLDLYRRDWASPDRMTTKKMSRPDWKTDVSIRVEKNGDNFKLILEAVNEDSGFVVEQHEFIEEMTEAPQQGYRQKLVLPFNKDRGGRLFAYVKSDGGLFYSKISVYYANRGGENSVELDWSNFTNVAGNRDLEFVHEIAAQYLKDQRENRRPGVRRKHLISGSVEMPVLGVE